MENPNLRLLALTDGVIAITITLLVLELRLPEGFGELSDAQLWGALLGLWPRLLAYLISFAVIGVYWINHHAKFTHIVKSDRGLLLINLIFLLFDGIVPFTTTLIAENPDSVGTAVYAGGMIACGLALAWLWSHAGRAGLIDPGFEKSERTRLLVSTLLSSGIFAVSVPLAFAHPDAAKFFWVLILPANIALRTVGMIVWRLRHPGEPMPERRAREPEPEKPL